MNSALIVWSVCTILYCIALAIIVVRDWKETNTRYRSELMLKIFIQEGKVILTNDRSRCEDKDTVYIGNVVFVKSEREFWRVFNEFNRISSKLFRTEDVSGRTGVAVCPSGKKLFHYEVASQEGVAKTEFVNFDVMAIPNPKAYRMSKKER